MSSFSRAFAEGLWPLRHDPRYRPTLRYVIAYLRRKRDRERDGHRYVYH